MSHLSTPGGQSRPIPSGSEHGLTGTTGRTEPGGGRADETRPVTAIVLVAMVIVELTFVLLAALLLRWTTSQSLQAASGATALATAAVYSRPMLIAVGRRIFASVSPGA